MYLPLFSFIFDLNFSLKVLTFGLTPSGIAYNTIPIAIKAP